MNEILVAFFILLTAIIMFVMIMLIVNADKKVIELNQKLEDVKKIDFSQLRKIVEIVHNINKHVQLSQVRKIIDITMSAISTIQLIIFYRKLCAKLKTLKKAV